MQRYFVSDKNDQEFTLSQEDSYHIVTVMRMKLEDKVEIVYEKKLYIGKIIELMPLVKVSIVEICDNCRELSIDVTIAQSLVKEHKMDYILQKVTELGANKIIPFNASRSVVNIENKEFKKISRWQKIAKEASEQAKRVVIPMVTEVYSLSELCSISGYDYKFLCTVNEVSQNIKKVLSNLSERVTILFIVGPEGGFTEIEEQALIQHDFIPISLGDSVLRTETASTFIMSVIRYLDMRC